MDQWARGPVSGSLDMYATSTRDDMSKLLTEFIGTFFLVLTIGLVVVGDLPMAPLTIGSVLMVMVYMGGHISGAHYNPAVSLAIALRGKMSGSDMILYWATQMAAAVVAALMVRTITGAGFAAAPGAEASTTGALLIEVLFTFALALVVLQVATSPKTEGNSFYGLAIGFTVMVGAWAGGAISGGAFNPAVGVGPILVEAFSGNGSLVNLWLYVVGPLLGGCLAVVVYKLQSDPDPLEP